MTTRPRVQGRSPGTALRAAATSAIERLERRALLSASIVHRTLFVGGTGADDVIDITTDGVTTIVTSNRGPTRRFANSAFDRIDIDAKNGDDTVNVADDITKPATLRGGRGDDCLKGGGGDDVLIAGLGNDTLDGGGGIQFGDLNTADYRDRSADLTISGGSVTTAAGEVDQFWNTQTLLSGCGDDYISTGSGSYGSLRLIDAGPGNDRAGFTGSYSGGTLRGGDGDDDISLSGFGRAMVYYGDAGNDWFRVTRSTFTHRDFHGGDGIDTVDYSGFFNPGWDVTVTLDDLPNDGTRIEQWPVSGPPHDNVHSDVERVIGSGGNDTMIGTDGNEEFIGGAGNDFLDGRGGDDLLTGDESSSFLFRYDDDTLLGGSGDDVLFGGTRNDSLDGGDGNDSLDYATITQRLSANAYLYPGTIRKGADAADQYANVETLICGSADDSINISGDSDRIRRIEGRAGNDVLIYRDNFRATDIAPTVRGGDGDDWLSVDRDAGSYTGGYIPTGGHAYYFGDGGNDTLRLERLLANRDFNGGDGIDYVEYGLFTNVGPMKITLDDLPGDGPYGMDNVHSDVERVGATPWNDTLVGNSANQTLNGEGGDDLIDGAGGDDWLFGGSDDDTILGGTGNDTITGDDVPSQAGNDLIYGGPGDDRIDCGPGDDTAYGQDGDDTLIGGPGADVLDGGAGHNLLIDELRMIDLIDPSAQVDPYAPVFA